MDEYMLTTYDNPYNPFTEFESWLKEDTILGHNCCGMLGSIANTSSIMSDELNDRNTVEAIDRIVELEPLIYKKVKASDYTRTNI